MPGKKPMTSVMLRLPPVEYAALQAWAARYGRNVSQEFRLAVRLLLLTHSLAYLQTDEGKADVHEQGLDLAEETAKVVEEMEKLTVAASTPLTSPSTARFVPAPREEAATA